MVTELRIRELQTAINRKVKAFIFPDVIMVRYAIQVMHGIGIGMHGKGRYILH